METGNDKNTVNIYAKLAAIQQAIKVPKDLDNSFAGFKYRSAETILEKLKPFLKEQNVAVILTDDVEDHSDQSYVKAYARMIDCADPKQWVEVSALAREEKTRPKMSEGQLTGAASSYARKYALNGLLLLDDNRDPDSQDNSKPKPTKATEKKPNDLATDVQRKLIADKLRPIGFTTPEHIKNYLATEYGIKGLLTKNDAASVISDLTAEEEK